jgi:hypothetical protein
MPMALDLPPLVAFAGYAGAGKDAAAQSLISRGYARHNFGDIIKQQLDSVVRAQFGFSAFTERAEEKARIRRSLESWGEDNYAAICEQFFQTLYANAVNTRLVRCAEAERWKARGGVIVLVHRPGFGAATAWEGQRLDELCRAGHIDANLSNDGDIKLLHDRTLTVLRELAFTGGLERVHPAT